jgi:hypothetical protein
VIAPKWSDQNGGASALGGATMLRLAMSLPISLLTRRLEARFARGQALV